MNRFKSLIITTLLLASASVAFAKDIPNGYKNITLGMSLDETKTELIKDSDFGYHGDRDVSLLPNSNKHLIETDADQGLGSNFLTNCYFQFNEEKLYIITINMNTKRVDYYSVFTTLKEKYGEPNEVTPQYATWKNENYTMTLEKPCALKYIDNKVFASLQNYSNVPLSGTEITKEQFLDQL